MTILFFLIGFVIALIAAAPPGAANIVVMNTVTNRSLGAVMFLIMGAGFGELILSLIALHCTTNFANYFEQNMWIQISVFILFILVGGFFLLRNKIHLPALKQGLKITRMPKFVTGFLLAFLNPPVLIFWVLAFSLTHKYMFGVSDMSPIITLVLFSLGVFSGKVATLYFYGKWGKRMAEHKKTGSTKKDLFIGVALLAVGILQGARYFMG